MADNKEGIAVEKEPLKEQSTAVDVDTVSNNEDIETQEEPEFTWSSILFAVLKILILGIAVFIYDIYSKSNDYTCYKRYHYLHNNKTERYFVRGK